MDQAGRWCFRVGSLCRVILSRFSEGMHLFMLLWDCRRTLVKVQGKGRKVILLSGDAFRRHFRTD